MSSSFHTILETAKLHFKILSEINSKHLVEILKSKYLFVLFLSVSIINFYFHIFHINILYIKCKNEISN